MILITTREIVENQREPWRFRLDIDARIVIIPTTGHPLDGAVDHILQAQWVAGFSTTLEPLASGAWRLGPRTWKRLVTVLQAHSVDPEFCTDPTIMKRVITTEGLDDSGERWLFVLYPQSDKTSRWMVVATGPRGRWIRKFSTLFRSRAWGGWVCDSPRVWKRLIRVLEEHSIATE